jgi:hypothetical protein
MIVILWKIINKLPTHENRFLVILQIRKTKDFPSVFQDLIFFCVINKSINNQICLFKFSLILQRIDI